MGMFIQDFGAGGGRPRNLGNFYKVVVRATLLFGLDTWVENPRIGRNLGGFHHRVYCSMAGMHTKRDMTGRW